MGMRARVCTLSGFYLWVWNHFVENECEKARMRGEEVKIFGATFRDSAIKKNSICSFATTRDLGRWDKKKSSRVVGSIFKRVQYRGNE